MKQLLLLITFLPEPLYTVVMAMCALLIVVFGSAIAYRLLLKIIDFDAPTGYYQTQPNIDDEDINHLHRNYYVQDASGNTFTISTNADGYVKSLQSNSTYIETTQPIKLTQSGLTCTLTDAATGRVIKEYFLANRNND